MSVSRARRCAVHRERYWPGDEVRTDLVPNGSGAASHLRRRCPPRAGRAGAGLTVHTALGSIIPAIAALTMIGAQISAPPG